MSQGCRAWIIKEADNAIYIRHILANNILLDGHILGESLLKTTYQCMVSERSFVKFNPPLRYASTEKYFVLLCTCTIIKEINKTLSYSLEVH